MARTYGRLHTHLVWATKNRERSIAPAWKERLYSYVGGFVRRCDGMLFVMGGVEDHVHIYLECPTTMAMSTLVNKIKANSSRWIHDTFHGSEGFSWQRGYSVFSVDPTHDARLKDYIRNQEIHHRRIDFEEEYLALARSHGFERADDMFD
jgi:putative transposase